MDESHRPQLRQHQPTKGRLKRRPPFSLEAIPYPLRRVTSSPETLPAWKQPPKEAPSVQPTPIVTSKPTIESPDLTTLIDQRFGDKKNHTPQTLTTLTPLATENSQNSAKPSAPTQPNQPIKNSWPPAFTPPTQTSHPVSTNRLQQLIETQAESLIKKGVEMALNGDSLIMQTLLERLLPLR